MIPNHSVSQTIFHTTKRQSRLHVTDGNAKRRWRTIWHKICKIQFNFLTSQYYGFLIFKKKISSWCDTKCLLRRWKRINMYRLKCNLKKLLDLLVLLFFSIWWIHPDIGILPTLFTHHLYWLLRKNNVSEILQTNANCV